MKVQVLVSISMIFMASSVFADEVVKKVPVANFNKDISCDALSSNLQDLQSGKLDPEQILIVTAAINKCAAMAYNKKQEEIGSKERVIPSAIAQNNEGKPEVLFNLVKISANDADNLRMVCKGMVSAASLDSGDPLLAPVISAAGSYSCQSYIEALLSSNQILLVAPTMVPGIDMTKDILRLAGVSEKDIEKAEKLVSKTATDLATVGVQSGVGVATGGMVTITPDLKCIKVFGKKVCR